MFLGTVYHQFLLFLVSWFYCWFSFRQIHAATSWLPTLAWIMRKRSQLSVWCLLTTGYHICIPLISTIAFLLSLNHHQTRKWLVQWIQPQGYHQWLLSSQAVYPLPSPTWCLQTSRDSVSVVWLWLTCHLVVTELKIWEWSLIMMAIWRQI